MKTKTVRLPIAGALAACLALGAQAGTLDPDLAAMLVGMDPSERVDVIIRCADPLVPGSVQGADRRDKRAKLIKALRARSTLCQRLVARELAGSGQDLRELWLANSVAAKVLAGQLERLAQRRGVEGIGLNREVILPEPIEPPIPLGAPGNPSWTFWNLSEVRIPDLWALGHYGQGVVVATLDTGVDLNHLDLAPNWRGGINSWFDPHGQHAQPFDASGHGTGVMGLLIGGNSLGVDIGAAPGAQWIAAKIFNDAGVSDLAKIHQAYQWILDPDGDPATDDAPDIVNNSWAITQINVCNGEFAADIAQLRAAEIAVVFSAGNFGPGGDTSVEPANNPGSLPVGAVDYYRTVLQTSSRGPSACDGALYPGLVAPGNSVFTTGLTSNGAQPQATQYGTGTSFAAPHVAGAMAVLKGAVPDATVAELEMAILGGALDLGSAELGTLGPDNESGAGYLDAVESYYLLASGLPSDADSDGVPDGVDQCPGTPAGETVDSLGCSASQLDSDGDGVNDALDRCPGTPAGTKVDTTGCPLPARPRVLLYLSLAANRGTLAGLGPNGSDLIYRGGDILSWDGTNYRFFFRGIRAGLPPSANIVAFRNDRARQRILMAFKAPLTVPGIPDIVEASDIVSYDRTTGAFSLFFDGSDVGLDSIADRIDALGLLPDGRLLISTVGNPTVPGLKGLADEDLLAFTPISLGEETSGTWALHFDGSDLGLNTSAEEDVNAAAVDRKGRIYLSTLGNFAVDGLSGENEDVLVCTPSSLGAGTTCSGFTLFFDGTAHGLSADNLDAIDLP